MDNEMMDLEQLASYLKRDVREVSKLANRGHLPGHKISGQWRFAPAEINYWIENQMHAYTEEELLALDNQTSPAPLVSSMLSEAAMAVPLPAGTRASVLKELVRLAEQTRQLYDPKTVLSAIKQREDMGSTALASGLAIPHPRRPLPQALGESVLAYGRTTSGIPFGSPHGNLTDIFFLVCCRDERTHLNVLARLSRLMLRPDFLDELRAAQSVSATYQIIAKAESNLIAEQ
jgi:PTS system nitrogen regulatory IIA component